MVSLSLHVTGIVGWEVARIVVRAFPTLFPQWVRQVVTPKPEEVKPDPLHPDLKPKATLAQSEEEVEIPLTFIEVDPSLVSKEAPKQTKFYSTDNTLAGNPHPPKPGATQPRIDGQREELARTMDVARAAPVPPAPTPPPTPPETVPTPAVVPTPEIKPQPARPVQERVEPSPPGGLKPGETQIAKINPQAVVERPQPRRDPRPELPAQPEVAAQPELQPHRQPIKRLDDARQQKGIIVSEKMKQDGGIPNFQIESSLDVKASPYGNYDRLLIAAIQNRWYALLDEHHFAFERSGKVVLKFKLRSDGSVTDISQVESQVGDIWSFICESAVLTQSPYAKWPSEMRRLVGTDSREITFTFHYFY